MNHRKGKIDKSGLKCDYCDNEAPAMDDGHWKCPKCGHAYWVHKIVDHRGFTMYKVDIL